MKLLLNALGIVIVVSVVNVWLLLPIVFLALVFYNFRRIYLSTARDVKRLEATSKDSFEFQFICLKP